MLHQSCRRLWVLGLLAMGLAACSETVDPAAGGGGAGGADAGGGDGGGLADGGGADGDVLAFDAEPDGGTDALPDAPEDEPEDGTDDDGDAGPVDDADDAADVVEDVDVDVDAEDGDGSGVDVETDVEVGEDARPDTVIEPGDEPQVVRTGTGGTLLRGDVLTPTGVIADGRVLIVGDTITCVGNCEDAAGAATATVIETNGIISPGLIDAHNHLAYNFLPEWVPPGGRLYENRYQWADDPSYEAWVLPYTANRSSNSHFCPASQWGELRSLLHGTTTIQGQSFERTCTQGMVRNADHAHELGDDHMQTSIGSVRDINDETADGYLMSFADGTTRFAVHMQEGYASDSILLEFDSFAGRDTRANRHAGVSLLGTTSVLIHSIALTEAQLDEAEAEGAYIVWSPSSNMVLYDRTLDLEAVLSRDIVVGIGPDWTISGEDDMLAELEFAAEWAAENEVALSNERLWRMATIDGAEVVGLGDRTGQLTVGYAADVTVFRRTRTDAYESVIRARGTDVMAVFIDGELVTGVESLAPLTTGCERWDVCGSNRFVCRPADPTYATIGDIEQTLVNILQGTGYPADEQYGRGDDLLPWVDCAR
jgi:cytosine/adenosine deaminase-related metal-dependent hydrolase